MTALHWGFVGHAGGGKTADMCYWALQHVNRGGALYRFPGFKMADPRTGAPIGKEVSLNEFIMLFQQEGALRNCVVDCDEIQNFAGSDQYMTAYNKLVSRMSMQSRKIQFAFHYSTQSWTWVDPRIRQLTGLLSVCKDLYHTPWGKERHIKRGHLIQVTTYDAWAYMTGREWTKLRDYVLDIAKPIPGFNHGIREFYESDTTVDPLETFRKLEIIKQVDKLDLRDPKPETHNMLDESALEGVPQDLREVSQAANAALIDRLEGKVDNELLRETATALRRRKK